MLLACLLAGCSDDAASSGAAGQPPAAPASAVPSSSALTAAAGAADPSAERVQAVLDGVQLELEVADDGPERNRGLTGRTSVPPGTGMVFRYEELSENRYWMFGVPIPLRAVFVREGRVVSTVLMPPCTEADSADCPTYGADEPYDTVVETAPETLLDVAPGDRFELAPA